MVVQPEKLVEEIEELGFDASVSTNGVLKRTVGGTIVINGMTDHSSVKKIEQQIGSYTGVQSIKACFLKYIY